MKLDPGIHIVMHSVFLLKSGVTVTGGHFLTGQILAAIFFLSGNELLFQVARNIVNSQNIRGT